MSALSQFTIVRDKIETAVFLPRPATGTENPKGRVCGLQEPSGAFVVDIARVSVQTPFTTYPLDEMVAPQSAQVRRVKIIRICVETLITNTQKDIYT